MSRARVKAGYALRVCQAAIAWWRTLRPLGWSLHQHAANPTVNCNGPDECNLALAVAKLAVEGVTEE